MHLWLSLVLLAFVRNNQFIYLAAGNENLKLDLATAFDYICVTARQESTMLLIVCFQGR